LQAEHEFVIVARILRPQGRRGEVIAEILTDFPEKFSERKKLWLADGSSRREATLEEHWFHKGQVVLKFNGVDSIGDAELLAGVLVEIPREARAELEPGAIYVSDLVGSRVIDLARGQRHDIGVIRDVQKGMGSAPLLLVVGKDREFEIPFAEQFIVLLDTEAKVVEMNLPQGLLEVNAPLSEEERREQNQG
jgi:16S rRNA processing protein RimM